MKPKKPVDVYYDVDDLIRYFNKGVTSQNTIKFTPIKSQRQIKEESDRFRRAVERMKKKQAEIKRRDIKLINPYNFKVIVAPSHSSGRKSSKDVTEPVMNPMMMNPKFINKKCPPGKVINELTGRCVKESRYKKINVKKDLDNILLHMENVKKLRIANNLKKPCPDGMIRNPYTGRCVSKAVYDKKVTLYKIKYLKPARSTGKVPGVNGIINNGNELLHSKFKDGFQNI